MNNSPYGKIVTLKQDINNIECWNYQGKSRHTLPKGTRLRLQKADTNISTFCLCVGRDGELKGIPIVLERYEKQHGYRFSIPNEQLNQIADAGLPDKAFDAGF